jgi:hypothetical protein
VTDEQLSKYFRLSEMLKSQTAVRRGLDNTPSSEVIIRLRLLCATMDLARDLFDAPVIPSSGYRSQLVNRASGSSDSSQHVLGEACDFGVVGLGKDKAFDLIRDSEIPFDQLIREYPDSPSGGWIHLSYTKRRAARREVWVYTASHNKRLA